MKTMILAVTLMSFAGAAEAAPKKTKLEVTGVVNLNQASEKQLDLLPGIGPKVAKRIVEYRAKSPFSTPAQVARVKGFGKKRYEKLKAYLTVAGPTTLEAKRVNATASEVAQGRAARKR